MNRPRRTTTLRHDANIRSSFVAFSLTLGKSPFATAS